MQIWKEPISEVGISDGIFQASNLEVDEKILAVSMKCSVKPILVLYSDLPMDV